MVAWAGIIGAALFGRAAAQLGSWQTLAGYQTASDVGPHSMIDLDMDEIESALGAYDFNEALRIYESGGNGFCVTANENGIGCEVVHTFVVNGIRWSSFQKKLYSWGIRSRPYT